MTAGVLDRPKKNFSINLCLHKLHSSSVCWSLDVTENAAEECKCSNNINTASELSGIEKTYELLL